MERRVKIAIGEIRCPPVRSLQMIILMPKIAYAVKQARCPLILLLSFISFPIEAAKLIILQIIMKGTEIDFGHLSVFLNY